MSKTRRRKILFVTLEPIAGKMAGPAIRALELGKQLADEFDVTVFSPRAATADALPGAEGVQLVTGGNKSRLYSLGYASDVLFVQANVLKTYPKLAVMGKYLVVDLYDPYLFSLLVQYQNNPVTASSSFRLMHQVLEKHMQLADFCICASERQRDYWLGRFCALGRIDPQMYKFDPSMRKLIDVVAFGLPDAKPERTGHGIKDKLPGISQTDRVLVWGGGIWDWFDPLTVIKAVAEVSTGMPELKLVFMGTRSPNPQVPEMEMTAQARKLAHDLKLIDKTVFFQEGWTAYEDRANFLLDADAAVSAHFDLIETRFSFRTRILDYLWAGLPILTTGGDQLADLIESRHAGIALPYEDAGAWAGAIRKIMTDSTFRTECKLASSLLAEEFTWSNTAKNLKQFCREPYHLPRYNKVTMPSILERAHSVYSRGGGTMVLKRSKELLTDLLK